MSKLSIDLLFKNTLCETLEIYKQSKDILNRSYIAMGLIPTFKITSSSTKGVKLNKHGLSKTTNKSYN